MNYVGGHLRGMQLSGRADAPKGLRLGLLNVDARGFLTVFPLLNDGR